MRQRIRRYAAVGVVATKGSGAGAPEHQQVRSGGADVAGGRHRVGIEHLGLAAPMVVIPQHGDRSQACTKFG